MFFCLKENKAHNPYYNLAREEALALSLAEFGIKGGIRFWRNPKTIVMGLSDSVSKNIPESIISNWQKDFSDLSISKSLKSHIIYVTRRSSGGGTVYQDSEENLNYSLFVHLPFKKELFPVKDSYQILLGIIQKSISAQGIECLMVGKSDLSLETDGKVLKVSGNSQFRKKDCIVQHGTLILHPNLIETISGNLFHPPEEPDYRKKRSHKEFLTALPSTFSVEKFQEDAKQFFLEYLGISESKPPMQFWQKIRQEIPKLQTTKFQNKDFILGKP